MIVADKDDGDNYNYDACIYHVLLESPLSLTRERASAFR